MAAINYSGSQSITGCSITTWTTSTYYSFKLTQDCKISVDGTPAINARAGDEFIIQVNTPYIFDRDTKVLLAYPTPESAPLATYSTSSTAVQTVYTTGYWMPILVINTTDALTSYTLMANAMVSNDATSSKTEQIRVIYGTTVLASYSTSVPANTIQLLYINTDLTTTIPANSTVRLEYYFGTANNDIYGNRLPTEFHIIEK